MGGKSKRSVSRNVSVDDFVELLNSIGLAGVQLAPANDDVNRNVEPLQSTISLLREASATNGPLSQAIDIISQLAQHSKQGDDTQHIWQVLGDATISIEALVELLNHLAESDPSPLSIAASCLYFALLRLPGAFLYHVFRALVFRTCITSLKKWIYAVGGTFCAFCPFLSFNFLVRD